MANALKSTLLNLVGLIDFSTTGTVSFDGQCVSSFTDDQLSTIRNTRIGFIFQGFNLIPVLTALENVMLPLHVMGVAGPSAMARALAILDELGLATHLSHRPHKLSGGQQQRVAIARALVTQPLLVIADEPTANLDSATARTIIDLMREVNLRHGTTFLFSTHDQRLLDRVTRRVHLEDGRVVGSEATAGEADPPARTAPS
ncbi:MAG: ABC transporter ATP-binding protein [Candidatus Riflebacteria bacterium]|nr:ABC transporter ATP-binding protein [Candidatus Riflebacteria bacterium]